jgi:uncharacterized protein YkwD
MYLRPIIQRRARLTRSLLALFLIGALIVGIVSTSSVANAASSDLDAEEQAFLALLNQYRAQNGLPPVAPDSRLNAASDWMSGDMLAKNYFSHTDSLGRGPTQRDQAFGYPTTTSTGETLAAGYTGAADVLAAWKAAAGPNAQLLTADWRAVGIGRACTGNCYWTVNLGNQSAGATAVAPTATVPAPTATVPVPTATVPAPTATAPATAAHRRACFRRPSRAVAIVDAPRVPDCGEVTVGHPHGRRPANRANPAGTSQPAHPRGRTRSRHVSDRDDLSA